MARMTPTGWARLRELAGRLDSGIEGSELNEARDRLPPASRPRAQPRPDGDHRGLPRPGRPWPWPNYRLPGSTLDRYQELVDRVATGDLAAADAPPVASETLATASA